MNKLKLLSILSELEKKETYFGPQGFVIVTTESELETAQHGFGVHPDGTDLSGFDVGDWKSSWVVIARDTELGDPYFVDISDDNFPVYTAVHVEGLWQPELVASSLDGFLECLTLLSENGNQECAQFVPDETTIEDRDRLAQLSNDLVTASGCENFWAMFFECYIDWLEDDDS